MLDVMVAEVPGAGERPGDGHTFAVTERVAPTRHHEFDTVTRKYASLVRAVLWASEVVFSSTLEGTCYLYVE